MVNPSYKQYVISDETKNDLKARVLPRFDAKKRERLRSVAERFEQRITEASLSAGEV